MPYITDPEAARAAPELAVLSVLAHGKEARGFDIACAVFAAAADLDSERSALYTDLAYDAISAAARAALEELMEAGKWEWKSPFAKKYVAIGKAEGKAEGNTEGRVSSLLTILDARGFAITDDVRAKILTCSDPAVLDRWLRVAVTAVAIDEVFA